MVTAIGMEMVCHPKAFEMFTYSWIQTLGVLYWNIEADGYEDNEAFQTISKERNYVNSDVVSTDDGDGDGDGESLMNGCVDV